VEQPAPESARHCSTCLGHRDSDDLNPQTRDGLDVATRARLADRGQQRHSMVARQVSAEAKDAKDQYHVRMDKWYPDALVNLFAVAHVSAPPTSVLWTMLQGKLKDANDLTPGWWLPAARRAGTERDVEHYRRQTVRFAFSLPDDAPVNRVATTLLALAGHRSRGVYLALPPRK
jgi:hypothetical protein